MTVIKIRSKTVSEAYQYLRQIGYEAEDILLATEQKDRCQQENVKRASLNNGRVQLFNAFGGYCHSFRILLVEDFKNTLFSRGLKNVVDDAQSGSIDLALHSSTSVNSSTTGPLACCWNTNSSPIVNFSSDDAEESDDTSNLTNAFLSALASSISRELGKPLVKREVVHKTNTLVADDWSIEEIISRVDGFAEKKEEVRSGEIVCPITTEKPEALVITCCCFSFFDYKAFGNWVGENKSVCPSCREQNPDVQRFRLGYSTSKMGKIKEIVKQLPKDRKLVLLDKHLAVYPPLIGYYSKLVRIDSFEGFTEPEEDYEVAICTDHEQYRNFLSIHTPDVMKVHLIY